eukprot:EG_transcript_4967
MLVLLHLILCLLHVLQMHTNAVPCPFPVTSANFTASVQAASQKCQFHGQAYECSEIFDPHYYVNQLFGSIPCSFDELMGFCHHFYCDGASPCASRLCAHFNLSTLVSLCDATLSPKTHYIEVGIKQGAAVHPGRDVVKIVLMHKDQWPLLRVWLLYHAHVFGFRNLIVLDESTQPEPTAFLQRMRGLGLTVLKTAGLSTMVRDLTQLFDSLRWSADHFIKLDTDEFIVSFNQKLSISDVFQSIRSAKLNGHRSRIYATFLYEPADINVCWPLGHTFNVANVTTKAFLPAATFSRADLGFHHGWVLPQFDEERPVPLALLHFHFICYAEWVQNAYNVLLGHQFLHPNDTKKQQMKKLGKLGKVRRASYHKIRLYLEHLTNETRLRSVAKSYHFQKSADYITYPEFNDLLSELDAACVLDVV